MPSSMALKPFAYEGRDLESMAYAVNYHRWIFDIFSPHLGKNIVEVGAGTGSFSELLLKCHPTSLSLIEPSEEMYERLRLNIASATGLRGSVQMYNSTLTKTSE